MQDADNNLIIKHDVLAKNLSSFRGGGIVKSVFYPKTVKNIITFLNQNKNELFTIGNGSNTLIADKGYNGTIIYSKSLAFTPYIEDDCMVFSSGMMLKKSLNYLYNLGFCGGEELTGIPATLGGGVVMNCGAFGEEIKNIVKKVAYIDHFTQKLHLIYSNNIPFSYRSSNHFFDNKTIIKVYLGLKKGAPNIVLMDSLNKKRKQTQPSLPSLGSTFKQTIEGISPGYLIEKVGLKGVSIGGAMISDKHANFIVNINNAMASDYISLMDIASTQVERKYKIKLEKEIIIL